MQKKEEVSIQEYFNYLKISYDLAKLQLGDVYDKMDNINTYDIDSATLDRYEDINNTYEDIRDEILSLDNLVRLSEEMHEEIRKFNSKNLQKELECNHLSYIICKYVRDAVSHYESCLNRYREEYKKSPVSNYFFSEQARTDLKKIRQALFMDEYEKEIGESIEYRTIIEEYEAANASYDVYDERNDDCKDGSSSKIHRITNAMDKLIGYEVAYTTRNSVVDNKLDSDDTMSSTPKAEEKTEVEKATPKLIIPTQEERKTNGLCIFGFILGILSMFSYWILPILLPLLAGIISGIGLLEVAETGEKGKGMGIWGLVLGIIYTIQSFIKLTIIGSI